MTRGRRLSFQNSVFLSITKSFSHLEVFNGKSFEMKFVERFTFLNTRSGVGVNLSRGKSGEIISRDLQLVESNDRVRVTWPINFSTYTLFRWNYLQINSGESEITNRDRYAMVLYVFYDTTLDYTTCRESTKKRKFVETPNGLQTDFQFPTCTRKSLDGLDGICWFY